MALINKIEHLIKREKLTPERVVDDSKKSSNEILSELFGVFNAAPPKLEELAMKDKKSKRSKKKHKKEKKKRSSSCCSSNSDASDYSHKHRKRKKAKSKKHRNSDSITPPRSLTPPKSPPHKPKIKTDKDEVRSVESSEIKIKSEQPNDKKIKEEKYDIVTNNGIFTTHSNECHIPVHDIPEGIKTEATVKEECRKEEKEALNSNDNEKIKGKIQIKNLKFSTVFEQTVKQAEEEARKKKERLEEGEYSDSSSSCENREDCNSQFPKSSDPGGILKQQAAGETKMAEDEKHLKKTQKSDSSRKPSRKRSRDRSRSHKRSRRSRSSSRRRHRRSTSKSRHKSRSRSRHRSKSGRRSRSRSRHRTRHSPRHRGRRSRSPTGVKLADSEKKRLLEVARRNAINMLKNGAVPAGAAVLPPHTRNQVMAAIQSGGKSVDELTDFCKNLSKKEALGELSSVSSNEGSDNEDTLAFHHPFLVKEKAPIVMNIRGGAPLPVKTAPLAIVDKDELRMQFPVSSGTQHREKASEWVPVSPTPKDMQIAKIDNKPHQKSASKEKRDKPLALPAPSKDPPPFVKSASDLSSLPALPAPGPQAYPPGIQPPPDISSIVSEKLLAIRREQEELESTTHGFGWQSQDPTLGQFTGSTGAHILTPKQLASGTQAWAKKDQLVRAAPVEGGMGMHLLQKMGWTPGQGLGKEGTGTLQPLLLEVKLDTRGLQAKEEVRQMRGRGGQGRRGGGGGGGGALLAGGKHPVSLLGEYCSKQKLGPPEYSLCFECGPDHKKTFLFRVKVAGVEYQPAVASANKKQAKADAAQLALQKLGILPIP